MNRQQPRSRRVRLLMAGLAGAALLGMLALGVTKGLSSGNTHVLAATATPTSITTGALSSEQRTCIDRFEGGVVNFGKLPPAKQAGVLQRMESCVSAMKHPSPFVVHGPPSPATTPRPLPQGILETGQAPFPAVLGTFINQWQAIRGGHWVHVYAGSVSNNSTQGFVLVQETSVVNYAALSGAVPYLTRVKAGPVRITAANGGRLTLTSTSGTTFVFDVDSRTFVSP